MRKLLIAPLIMMFAIACQHSNNSNNSNSNNNDIILESPSKNLKVVVKHEDGKLNYQVFSKSVSDSIEVIKPSALGLIRDDSDFSNNLSLLSVSKTKSISESYSMITGKQKELSYTANETDIVLRNQDGKKIQITFRLFDEGLAFRYSFPESKTSEATVISEVTSFALNDSSNAWMATYQAAKPWGDPGYEAPYASVKTGTPSIDTVGWAFPLLFKDGKNWIFISEANLDETYCGTHLKHDCSGGVYTIALPEADERFGDGQIHPSSSLPWTMPWRFILVGDKLEDIVESSMVDHLAQPSQINDESWIKPGRVSWEWWSSKGGRTVANLKHFIDLAAEMTWEYSLVDAGWENMPDGNIQDVIEYANSKNVGLFLWYNSGGRRDSTAANEDFAMFNNDTRNAEMARIAAMGIKGIKVDFFATDKQIAMKLYTDILRDAANHKLLVNFHGCTLPRGWSRTWPHLLTMEAVRGAECYRFSETYPEIAANYNTIAAVTRGVVGPTDYTPATFSDHKFPHKTTSAHELALTLIYETGLLHLADKPESYYSLPAEAINFLKNIPVTWDETKVLKAIPGEVFVVARRKGDNWYVAGINGLNQAQVIELELPFNIQKAKLFFDDEETGSLIVKDVKEIKNSLRIKLKPHGGFVVSEV